MISSGRLRSILTGVEVSVSVVLLIAAGLMLKSFVHLITGNLGIGTDRVLTMRLVLPANNYFKDSNPAKLLPFANELLSKLQNLLRREIGSNCDIFAVKRMARIAPGVS